MINIIPIGTGQPLTMSSLEISQLVEQRHDNVKRTIETLGKKGVISLPQIEEVKIQRERREEKVGVYNLGKRDSLVVVAQLCPEFTARIVDRWQELEEQIAKPQFSLPQSLPEALRLAAELAERKEAAERACVALESKVAEQAPKVQALERFANHEGNHNLRSATKLLGIQENKLKAWLLVHKWYYRDHSGRLCAYADKISAGTLDTVPVEIQRSDGVQVVPQPVITQKGLAKLAELLAKDGLLPKEHKEAA